MCIWDYPLHSTDLILETLKDEISLHILKLFDLLLLLQLVVFHGARNVMWRFFRVEHMCTQIKHRLLVWVACARRARLLSSPVSAQRLHGIILIFQIVVLRIERILHRIPLDKFRNFVNKHALFEGVLKTLFRKITQTNEQVNQNRSWQGSFS